VSAKVKFCTAGVDVLLGLVGVWILIFLRLFGQDQQLFGQYQQLFGLDHQLFGQDQQLFGQDHQCLVKTNSCLVKTNSCLLKTTNQSYTRLMLLEFSKSHIREP
jgi:hypothetical protein